MDGLKWPAQEDGDQTHFKLNQNNYSQNVGIYECFLCLNSWSSSCVHLLLQRCVSQMQTGQVEFFTQVFTTLAFFAASGFAAKKKDGSDIGIFVDVISPPCHHQQKKNCYHAVTGSVFFKNATLFQISFKACQKPVKLFPPL